jgi:hypothetical protein
MEMTNQIFDKIFDLKDKVGVITGGSSCKAGRP